MTVWRAAIPKCGSRGTETTELHGMPYGLRAFDGARLGQPDFMEGDDLIKEVFAWDFESTHVVRYVCRRSKFGSTVQQYIVAMGGCVK